MARSDSDATSFSDEGGYSVPKRLFPAEITTMLFTSEPESDFAPETIEDASLFQLGTVPVCSVEYSDDGVAFGESSTAQTVEKEQQYSLEYTATTACQLLMQSSYETSADEQSSLSTLSSDPVFDLSDPDATVPECNNQDDSQTGQPDSFISDNESSDSGKVVSRHQPTKVANFAVLRSTRTAPRTTRSISRTARSERQPVSHISDGESSDSSQYHPTEVATLKSTRTHTSKMTKTCASNKRTRRKSKPKKKSAAKPRKEEPEFSTHNISEEDEATVNYTKFPFAPHRNVGIHLPPGTTDTTPKGLFQLYFTDQVVDEICRCSNEYAELMKDQKPGMYSTYKEMNPDDFLKMVGMLIHFGYRKLPQYKLAWRRQSLCYDPFIAATMGRNKFHSLMSFLHIVDKSTEEKMKKGDKLVKVHTILSNCVCAK